MARGDEFIFPVSFLITRENVVDIFQLLLNGAIQQQPVKPTVTMSPIIDEKSYVRRCSPNDQFSSGLKSVHTYDIAVIVPEQPYWHVRLP